MCIRDSHIMGLIGKNGAGKSTTLKAILNMVSPESGRVTMFQKNFYQHEKECKQRIGVVFGGIDFYPLKKLSDIAAVTQKFYKNWDQEQYQKYITVSYTHLRAHETGRNLVCRLLLEKKKKEEYKIY